MTNDNLNLLNMYIKDIIKIPLLSQEEELQYATQRQRGEEAKVELIRGIFDIERRHELEEEIRLGEIAMQRLMESNLMLVASIAKKYKINNISDMDLIQEGNIGLQNGIEKYDYTKGFRLATYAYWWIRKAMSMAIQNQRSVRLPSHITASISKVKQTAREIEQEDGEEATSYSIGERLGMESDRIKELMSLSGNPSSLDQDVNSRDSYYDGDEEISLADVYITETPDTTTIVENNMLSEFLIETIDKVLSEKESIFIKIRFGLMDGTPRSLVESGKRMGISRSRAGQIEIDALNKLRNNNLLYEYFYGDNK